MIGGVAFFMQHLFCAASTGNHRQAEGLEGRHLRPLSTMSSKCLLHGRLANMQDMKNAYIGRRRSCSMDTGCSLCLQLETHEAITLKR